MFDALKLARSIMGLGNDSAALLTALVNKVRGESPRVQRMALDAAFSAAEAEVAKRIRMQP